MDEKYKEEVITRIMDICRSSGRDDSDIRNRLTLVLDEVYQKIGESVCGDEDASPLE